MNQNTVDQYKLELSVKAKNGVNFIAAASVVWTLITIVWTLSFKTYDKCVLTFIVGGVMLPLAFVFSKIFKTQWTVEGNPLQSLGLWLNFAQLFYFPILIFVLLRSPEDFVFVYVVITGAHFFPYAWYYNAKVYSIMAGVISLGAMFLALYIKEESQLFYVPAFMVVSLIVTAIGVYAAYQKSLKLYQG
ncbi:MAG: DUF7010 family protein [Cytophagales bacterium]